MESMNAKKQALLGQALQERRLKTQQEQARLNKVQRELNQLEQSLQVDVNRLREKIEEGIKDYSAAKTRYGGAGSCVASTGSLAKPRRLVHSKLLPPHSVYFVSPSLCVSACTRRLNGSMAWMDGPYDDDCIRNENENANECANDAA